MLLPYLASFTSILEVDVNRGLAHAKVDPQAASTRQVRWTSMFAYPSVHTCAVLANGILTILNAVSVFLAEESLQGIVVCKLSFASDLTAGSEKTLVWAYLVLDRHIVGWACELAGFHLVGVFGWVFGFFIAWHFVVGVSEARIPRN